MSKGELYKIDKKENNNKKNVYEVNNKNDFISFCVSILVYAFVLMVANSLFKGIEIKSFFSAIIAALILSGLNYTIKPILIYWTLPLTVMTYGIAYPIVNMIILKLCDIIMGSSFNINGFFATFIIAIFISGLRIILDNIITKNVGR